MTKRSEKAQPPRDTQPIGHQIHYYREIGSTNDEAFLLGTRGAPHGTAVVAESQTAGRGRLSRVWVSPPGANVYTSVVLRPSLAAALAPQISLAAGVAVARTLEPYCPGRVGLKWPNDVQIDGKKVCGILAQMKLAENDIDFVVVGIGINVNWQARDFPTEIRDMATSLVMETGREHSREDLLNHLYENLTKWYMSLLDFGFEPVRDAWLGLSPMIGETVSVQFGEETICGRAAGLGDDGCLILETAGNVARRISAGDATILKR